MFNSYNFTFITFFLLFFSKQGCKPSFNVTFSVFMSLEYVWRTNEELKNQFTDHLSDQIDWSSSEFSNPRYGYIPSVPKA